MTKTKEEIKKISMLRNYKKRYCCNGHVFDIVKNKKRICSICEKARKKKYNAKNRVIKNWYEN